MRNSSEYVLLSHLQVCVELSQDLLVRLLSAEGLVTLHWNDSRLQYFVLELRRQPVICSNTIANLILRQENENRTQ